MTPARSRSGAAGGVRAGRRGQPTDAGVVMPSTRMRSTVEGALGLGRPRGEGRRGTGELGSEPPAGGDARPEQLERAGGGDGYGRARSWARREEELAARAAAVTTARSLRSGWTAARDTAEVKQKERDGLSLEVYIKWESGNLIKGLKLLPTACLSDLRKLVETHFDEASNKKQQQHHHQFTFLLLGDPSVAPVSREKESTVQISKLPNWNNQTNSYLACLRAVKKPAADQLHQIPFSPLESKLNSALNEVQQQHLAAGALSPKVVGQMSPSFIRELRA